jgi:hypothetical protein
MQVFSAAIQLLIGPMACAQDLCAERAASANTSTLQGSPSATRWYRPARLRVLHRRQRPKQLGVLTITPYFMGFSPEVLFAANLVIGLQGPVPHFTVDSCVGMPNYLVMGTEFHRHHHSADPSEAKNFGAAVSV